MRVLLPSAALSLALALAGAARAQSSPPQQAQGEPQAKCALKHGPDRRATPSSACMACHDGTRAQDANMGHRYDIAYEVKPGRDLRPSPEQFNPKIVLSNGRVTCLSCHDPGSELRVHLAAPTGGEVKQRLCVACHLFD